MELSSPVQAKLPAFVRANRVLFAGDPLSEMVGPDEYIGKTIAVCGAGPSLNDERIRGVTHVFACNSALQHLLRSGVKVHAAVGIDQSPGLLREWSDVPTDIPFYVASSCDPHLIQHLITKGCRLRWFHNMVGIDGELDYYKREWPTPMFAVGMGMTVVSRFVWVAQWMGFERIDIYGADCAFGPNDVAHANGESAAKAYGAPVIMEGETNGRVYRTRPDMLRDAVGLARMVQQSNGRFRLIGDTLPVQLLGKSEEYLNQVSRTLSPGERPPAEASPLSDPSEIPHG